MGYEAARREPVDLQTLRQLTPAQVRDVLPAYVSGYIRDRDVAARNLLRCRELIATWSDEVVRGIIDALVTLGDEHRLYDANPHCRTLQRVWSRDVFPTVDLIGAEHLVAAAARGPTVVVCNHLSYVDSTAIDALLTHTGHPDLADRVFSIAGPKVYESLFRRFASLCLGTLPVPQSTSLGHTASLSPRELARRALASVSAAEQALATGRIALLYAEGSRSRTGHLRPFLKGVHRYLSFEGLSVVPAGLSGTQHVMRVEHDERLHPHPVRLALGEPVRVHDHGSARDVLPWVHDVVAGLLPEDQRPEPGDAAVV